VRNRFTRCPRCHAHTRLRKLPLVIHVEHRDGPRLTLLGKTCRLCIICEVLIAHEQEVTELLVAAGVAPAGERAKYVALGTLESCVWRAGLARDVTLEAVRSAMADFKQYLRIDITPGGWYREADAAHPTDNASCGKPALRPRGGNSSS
jgi:hypothetical protein